MKKIAQKPCPKCGEIKPITDYHKKMANIDNLANWCKPCTLEYQTNWKNQNREAFNKKRREYAHKNKERLAEIKARHRAKHPDRQLARWMVTHAIEHAKITPQPCEVCGVLDNTIEGHHEDYSRPLKVNWLCNQHHRAKHKEI
jgi:hypothetical protein